MYKEKIQGSKLTHFKFLFLRSLNLKLTSHKNKLNKFKRSLIQKMLGERHFSSRYLTVKRLDLAQSPCILALLHKNKLNEFKRSLIQKCWETNTSLQAYLSV